MIKFLRNLDPLVHLIFLICIIVLATGFYFLHKRTTELNSRLQAKTEVKAEKRKIDPPEVKEEVKPGCDKKCLEEEIKRIVLSLIKKDTPVLTKNHTSFIPLPGPSTTTKTDWTDLKNTDVTIDFKRDYGAGAKITWEAFLKVADGNGKAYARLLDVTHGTAIDGSEIYLENNASLTNISSGNLNPWSGNNTYRVQIKSLNSFVVTFDSGRIKISY